MIARTRSNPVFSPIRRPQIVRTSSTPQRQVVHDAPQFLNEWKQARSATRPQVSARSHQLKRALRSEVARLNTGKLGPAELVALAAGEVRRQPPEFQVRALAMANQTLARGIEDPGLRLSLPNLVTRRLRGQGSGPINLIHGPPRRGRRDQGGVVRAGSGKAGPIDWQAVERLAAASKGELVFAISGRLRPAEERGFRRRGASIAYSLPFTGKPGHPNSVVGFLGQGKTRASVRGAADWIERELGRSGADYMAIDELPSSFKDNPTGKRKLRAVSRMPALLEELRRRGLDKKLILWGRFGAPPQERTVQIYRPLLESASLRARSVIYETYPSKGSPNQRAIFPAEVLRGRGESEVETTAAAFENAVPGVTTASLTGVGVFQGVNQLPSAVERSNYREVLPQIFRARREGRVTRLQPGIAVWTLARRPESTLAPLTDLLVDELAR